MILLLIQHTCYTLHTINRVESTGYLFGSLDNERTTWAARLILIAVVLHAFAVEDYASVIIEATKPPNLKVKTSEYIVLCYANPNQHCMLL